MATAGDRPSFPMRVARDLHVVAYALLLAVTVLCAVHEPPFIPSGGLLLVWYGLLAWGLAWGMHRARPRVPSRASSDVRWHVARGACLLQGIVYAAAALGLLILSLQGRPCEPFRAFSRLPDVVSLSLGLSLLFQGPIAVLLGFLVRLGTRDGRILATALWLGALPFLAQLLILADMALGG